MRKIDVLKTCRKSEFLGKKFWRNICPSFEEQKGASIIVFSCLSSTKLCLRFLLNCFLRETKRFFQSSLGNLVDIRDIMNVSLNVLAKNQNFKKLKHSFVDERALITTTLISFCHWKTLVPFCLRRKIPENLFLTLILNYRKIVQKKICRPKQQ